MCVKDRPITSVFGSECQCTAGKGRGDSLVESSCMCHLVLLALLSKTLPHLSANSQQKGSVDCTTVEQERLEQRQPARSHGVGLLTGRWMALAISLPGDYHL